MKGRTLKFHHYVLPLALLSGCGNPDYQSASQALAETASNASASLDFPDAPAGSVPFKETPELRAQVLLDRLGFSTGVIDGKSGQSFQLALRGFQTANGLNPTGLAGAATWAKLAQWRDVPATRLVTIPAAFAKGPFFPDFPKAASAQAKLPTLGYRDLMEALAERFHTTTETLIALNSPSTRIGAGKVIRVPNIPNASVDTTADDPRGWSDTLQRLGVSANQPAAERVVVDKSEGVLKVYAKDDRLIAQFPATMGSSNDPLPIGSWKIQGVSRNPDYHYNPKLFWDVSDSKAPQMLKPGPNSPVGVVWLDLNKPHYGIHGTSEPQMIGRAESHGCVRLTNWDAARLAQMVKPGTPAELQP